MSLRLGEPYTIRNEKMFRQPLDTSHDTSVTESLLIKNHLLGSLNNTIQLNHSSLLKLAVVEKYLETTANEISRQPGDFIDDLPTPDTNEVEIP